MVRAILLVVGLTGCLAVPASRSAFGWRATAHGLVPAGSIGVHLAAFDRADRGTVDVGAGYAGERGASGTYISLDRRLSGRWWLGGRVEQLWPTLPGAATQRGLFARLALREHLAGVSAVSRDGTAAAYGAVAAAAYVERGAREVDGGGAVTLAIGFALDLPLLFAAAR